MGEQVFDTLIASARGDHAIGAMGRHVTTGLLVAQREEGLRQVILETVDEAHPDAFRRMLRLILDHDLIRFSATVRAADVWFGFNWGVDHGRAVRDTLGMALRFLDDGEARRAALATTEPPAAYLALWATAFDDADDAVVAADSLLTDVNPERRLVAAYLLAQLGLGAARQALVPLLDDPDQRVALCAFSGLDARGTSFTEAELMTDTDLFERLERLLVRLGSGAKMSNPENAVWPWQASGAVAGAVAHALIDRLGDRSPQRLIPHLSRMRDYDRVQAAKLLAAAPTWDTVVHDTIFALVRDCGSWVRESALGIIAQRPLTPVDAPALEALLTRKSGDTRRALLSLLLNQGDDDALCGAERLLSARHPLQRLAGLDLLSQLAGAGRQTARCYALAQEYQAAREATQRLTPDETTRLDAVLSAGKPTGAAPTLDNALGLIAPDERTAPVCPRHRRVDIDTPAARALLAQLDALIESQRTTPVTVKTWRGGEEMLLGNADWRFPSPHPGLCAEDDARDNLPLAEVWRRWEAERTARERDGDGLEVVRAMILLMGTRAGGATAATPDAALGSGTDQHGGLPPMFSVDALDSHDGVGAVVDVGLPDILVRETDTTCDPARPWRLRHHHLALGVLCWLVRLQDPVPAALLDFLLDGVEAALASVPHTVIEQERDAAATETPDWRRARWRDSIGRDGTISLVEHMLAWRPDLWSGAHRARYWALLHWLDRPLPGLPRRLPPIQHVLAAHRAGSATEADLLDALVTSAVRGQGYYAPGSEGLATLSGRAPRPLMDEYPILKRLVPALCERIVQVELARGEMPTAATPLTFALRYTGGMDIFASLLASLAPTGLTRGYAYDNEGRATAFSHLLRATFPGAEDTAAQFARMVDAAGLDTERLVAAAVYAPQWARRVEDYLAWPCLEEAIWWTHAHTKDTNWGVDARLKEVWQAEMSERTPLAAQDLLDGAVDVDWFRRGYQALGQTRWEQVYAAAKYASGGTGHARARLFADAMTGAVTPDELGRRIAAKRTQDAVRALGLLPLPVSDGRAEEVAARYNAIQDFVRGGKKFGPQRRASEEAAARIGLENLARTAGYADPMRLQWAMEARVAADLRDGAKTVTGDDIDVTLTLDALTAEPRLTVTKTGGRALKTLPARLKKNPEVAALVERKREIERQVARMRLSLEAAMCRGDRFEAAELARLLDHPVLARLLRNLIFVRDRGDGASATTLLGYPALAPDAGADERLLQFTAHDGAVVAVDARTCDLRLAHPHGLFVSDAWRDWQHNCFASERIQPFKQVFRELYVLTANERRNGDDALSGRYSGQQVQPQQAMALLGTRGWVAHADEGVRRAFYADGLSAVVTFDHGVLTPAEVEGLTLDDVLFTRRGEWTPIPLADVPPRVFSEVMRDLDLVVSVAHRGGVDPEATASTVEMRAALVRETCGLLGLDNVDIKSAHAVVEGGLGDYSIHLGSAVVHRQPGGALCIVPVHSQHRGRLFLPFSDNDPRTAEVVSKVILLARDKEIKDPSILEQIL